MSIPERIRITAAEYHASTEYDENDLIELIDGEVVTAVPPTLRHQDIVGEIFHQLKSICRRTGGRTYVAPTDVCLDGSNSFEPDVLYIRPGSQCVLEARRVVGAPDLVVEVLSPATARYDRQQKYDAYQRNGVAEYWIVDPVHELIEVWTLGDGGFVRQGAFARGDTFQSATLGEAVTVETIFAV